MTTPRIIVLNQKISKNKRFKVDGIDLEIRFNEDFIDSEAL